MTQLTLSPLADRFSGHERTAVPDRTSSGRAPRPGSRELLRRGADAAGIVLPALILAVVLAAAVAPGLFTSVDPLAAAPADRFLAPSTTHWFGTDYIGRDIFSRVVNGTALSLKASAVALAIGFVISSVLGLLAGFVGGSVDSLISRTVDVLLSIPGLLLSLVLVTVLGFGTVNVAIAVGLASVAALTRVMRAEVMKVSSSPFVEAARLSGARWYTVLLRHVLPHATGPVLSLLALQLGEAILTVAALSFLGFGAELPTPEWGNLVAEGRSYLSLSPWMTLLPAATIVVTVLSANWLSSALAERSKGALR